MEIRTLPLTQLQPAPYNPRQPLRPGSPAYRRLARSLQEFDLVQPIVWNETTGYVVSGHQRLDILRAQGREMVEVVVVRLTPAREKALNIALNNSQVGSDWDPAKLLEVVAELRALPEFDATLTGFDEEDLRDLQLTPAAYDGDAGEAFPSSGPQVEVCLKLPLADWETFRAELDRWLARHPAELHVRLPSGTATRRRSP